MEYLIENKRMSQKYLSFEKIDNMGWGGIICDRRCVMRRMTLLLIMFLSTLSLIISCGGGGGGSTSGGGGGKEIVDGWTIETIDKNVEGGNGEINAVIDKQGKLHVSYYDFDSDSIRYVTNKNGKWEGESIAFADLTPGAGQEYLVDYNSIAVDANGNAHILYHVRDNGGSTNDEAIYYATNAEGHWTKEKLTSLFSPYDSFGRCIIRMDPNGNLHAIWDYYFASERRRSVIYAYKLQDGWHTETVATWDDWFYIHDLALGLAMDANNLPHVIFANTTGLYSAVRTGDNTWNTILIVKQLNDPEDDDITNLDVAVDQSGKEYIILYENIEPHIWLIEGNRAVSIYSIPEEFPLIPIPKIVADNHNVIHYLYFIRSSNDTYGYAHVYANNKNGSFTSSEITAFLANTPNSALAVDSLSGEIYIIYTAIGANELRVAHKKL